MNATAPTLVPNRTCGACTYCCVYLPIDTPELQVRPVEGCKHCLKDTGCAIYETRPQNCRHFYCGWRLSEIFDDSWRPDLSGVLITPVTENIPKKYMQQGLELLIVHPKLALNRPDFSEFIFLAVANKVPVFLCRLGPIGYGSAGVILNPILEDPVARNDQKDFKGLLNAVFQQLKKGPFKPVVLVHDPQK